METLYVTLEVTVSNNRHGYSGMRGCANAQIQVPREVITSTELGTVFLKTLKTAVTDFDTPKEKEE